MTIQGEMTDRPGLGNRLLFTLPELDQTFLPALIEQLLACEKAYPIVGRPAAG